VSDADNQTQIEVERRITRDEVTKIFEALHALDMKLTTHIQSVEDYKPKVLEVIDIFQKGKGAVIFIKVLFYVVAPLGAFIYWVRDHVKL